MQISSVQLLSLVQIFVTPWTATLQASLYIIKSWSLLENSCPLSRDAIQLFHPLSSPSHQGLFQWVSSSHQWPKYWSFSFSISPSNEYSGLIVFTINWIDLLAVQRILKSLLQHHSSKESILQLVSLSQCLSLSLCVCLCVCSSLSVWMSLYLSVCVCVSLYVYVSKCVCVSQCVSHNVSVSQCVCVSHCVSVLARLRTWFARKDAVLVGPFVDGQYWLRLQPFKKG